MVRLVAARQGVCIGEMDPDQEAHIREGFLERMSSATSNGKRVPLSPISKVPWADVSWNFIFVSGRQRVDQDTLLPCHPCSQHWPCHVSTRHGRNFALQTLEHFPYRSWAVWLRASDPFALHPGVSARRLSIHLIVSVDATLGSL